LVSLDEKVKAEEALVSKTSTELCDRKAMLVAQRKLIEEKEKEIAAKEKLYDNAWEDLEAGVWGRESSQAKVKEMQKENNASKQELNRKQTAIAATSADLEERRKKIEEGRRLIASARNQMTTLKGAVDREEKIVEKEEATLNFLSKALSQQSEMNKGYQGALMNAQSELHMSYHNAVDKQGKAIDHLKGVHSGIAETMGLQDAAMQSVQQAISETKRALAWCSDESLKEYLQDRAKNFDQKLKDFNEVQPPPQQNPNQIVANRLKEKIDELVKALPKDSPYKSF
jgi:chromosome segregation ATPase